MGNESEFVALHFKELYILLRQFVYPAFEVVLSHDIVS
jgi:hypothetical protein